MKQTLRLSPVANLSSVMSGGELVAFNADFNGIVYLVVALKPLDYRIQQPAASFAKIVPDHPQTYRVVALRQGEAVFDIVIKGERFNVHHVQPVEDKLLLVCARSEYRGTDDFDKNGRVYTRTGEFAGEILLGDGIQDVQATPKGVIWTSYFDEGVFGNFGWHEPVGATGLVAWSIAGTKLFEFQPSEGLDSICDCYALNVASDDEVWCYYHTEFPLVLIRRNKIAAIWNVPLGGSHGFAVADGFALFQGGYEDRDMYQLLALGDNGEVNAVAKFEFKDQRGERLLADRVVGRGNVLHLLSGQDLYRVEVSTAVEAFGSVR
jgi:hypothetical protein